MALRVVDLTELRLANENEIDNALYAVLVAAFVESDEGERQIRVLARRRLSSHPSPSELIDAVCAELRLASRLRYEKYRRDQAALVLAAFLELPALEREDVSLMPAA